MDPKPDIIAVPHLQTPDYSTLEVDQSRRWVETDLNIPPEAAQDPRNEKIYAGESVYPVRNDDENNSALPKPPSTICGIRRTTALLLIAAIFITAVVAIAGGIGGTLAAHHHISQPAATSTSTAAPSGPSTTHSIYQNTGMAAIQWTDSSGTKHYRVYYQHSSNTIQESAWDSNGSGWNVSEVSDPARKVKTGTPIAAAAGYPHANVTYTLVKNVYYMADNDQLIERQTKSNDSHAWENDNFSGLYSGTNSTFLAAYWNQNFNTESEELVVLFQPPNFANGLTMGKYTSNVTSSYPWVVNDFAFATPPGSTFALSPVGSSQDLILYTIDTTSKLVQHEYTLNDNITTNIISTTDTPTQLNVQSTSPLTISRQDNTPLFTTDTLPECSKTHPLTHLIIYTVADRSSLILNTWNCTDGFIDTTSQIQPFLKSGATYLGLASHDDAKVYVMFDMGQGNGPMIEEWSVPEYSGQAWGLVSNVTAEFQV